MPADVCKSALSEGKSVLWPTTAEIAKLFPSDDYGAYQPLRRARVADPHRRCAEGLAQEPYPGVENLNAAGSAAVTRPATTSAMPAPSNDIGSGYLEK